MRIVDGVHGGALPFEGGVPVVLNGIVGSAEKESGYGGPLVAELSVSSDYGVVLFWGEGSMLHGWGELVAPSKPARLALAEH